MCFIYLNGEFVAASDACVSIHDQGLMTGHGFFETVRVENGAPLGFCYHYERFSEAAKRLKIKAPTEDDLITAISELLSKNEITQAKLRITLTGGNSPFPAESGNPTLLITTSSLPIYAESAKVVTVPFVRNERGALSGIKSISYGESLLAIRYAKAQGADEAIFANTQGHLCEGATTNVFVIIENQLCTPSLSSGCLPGTCRSRVLEICDTENIPLVETEFPMPLSNLEFAFLTSSIRYLQPVREFDGRKLPITHPVFDRLQKHFP